jgi:hypothetical protein
MKRELNRLEQMDHMLERHISLKFEELSQKQNTVNKALQQDLSGLKKSINGDAADENSLTHKIVNAMK